MNNSDLRCLPSGRELSVACFEHPPFVYRNLHTKETLGVIFHNTLESLEHCCSDITTLNPRNFCTRWFANENEALHDEGDIHTDIYMPITHFTFDQSFGESYLTVMSSPGTILLAQLPGQKEMFSHHLLILMQAWPLLCIILISAGYAGIFMWLLDRKKNPKEFSKSFLNGFWDGLWWAFVTMTTVGYGDRCPKSPQARIFAIVWIIFGICTITVFTATITTALTEGRYSNRDRLFSNNKMYVMNGSFEKIKALEKGRNIRVLNSTEALFEKARELHNLNPPTLEVADVIMEHFMVGFYLDTHSFGIRNFTGEWINNKPSLRGLLVNLPNPVRVCMRQFFNRHRFLVYDELQGIMNDSHHHIDSNDEKATEVAKELFKVPNAFIIFVLFVVLMSLFALAAFWECYGAMICHRNRHSAGSTIPQNCLANSLNGPSVTETMA